MSVDPNMLALEGMMSGSPDDAMMMDPMMDPAMAGMPMEPGMEMGGDIDPMGVTDIPVPNWAVPAVIELIALLEEAMGEEDGMAPEDMMNATDAMMMEDMGPPPMM